MSDYRLYTFRGQPVLAVPVGPHWLVGQALDRYPRFSENRARWRQWMLRLHKLCLDRLLERRTTLSQLEEHWPGLAVWAEQLRQSLGADLFDPVITWPTASKQEKQRLYAFVFNPDGPVGFVKLSRHEKDAVQFDRERRALQRLQGAGQSAGGLRLRVPQVLSWDKQPHGCWLATTLAPASARSGELSWDQLVPLQRLYRGPVRQMTLGELIKGGELGPSEFTSDDDVVGNEPWMQPLLEQRDRLVRVCAVHGDLQPNNILRDGNDVWLIDWERAAETAPVLVDVASYFKSRRRDLISASPPEAYNQLYQLCRDEQPETDELDLLANLVYFKRRGDRTSIDALLDLVLHAGNRAPNSMV